jgi:hypothetical protein
MGDSPISVSLNITRVVTRSEVNSPQKCSEFAGFHLPGLWGKRGTRRANTPRFPDFSSIRLSSLTL